MVTGVILVAKRMIAREVRRGKRGTQKAQGHKKGLKSLGPPRLPKPTVLSFCAFCGELRFSRERTQVPFLARFRPA